MEKYTHRKCTLEDFSPGVCTHLARTQIRTQNVTGPQKSPCAPSDLRCRRSLLLVVEPHINGIIQMPLSAQFLSINIMFVRSATSFDVADSSILAPVLHSF